VKHRFYILNKIISLVEQALACSFYASFLIFEHPLQHRK
jgi:hypothetical protein